MTLGRGGYLGWGHPGPPSQPDRSRLTSLRPKMIVIHHKYDAHSGSTRRHKTAG